MLGNSDVTRSQNVTVKPGEDISTCAMLEYFKPLMSWVEEQNKGRQIGWE
jgi:Angiotensin-converting enzyme